eukprot:524979_1
MEEPAHSDVILSSHTWTAAFKCEFCHQDFHLKEHLIRHVSDSHPLSFDTVKCEEMSFSGSTSYNLNDSMIQHVTDSHQLSFDTVKYEPTSPSSNTSFVQSQESSTIDQRIHCQIFSEHRNSVVDPQHPLNHDQRFKCSFCDKSFQYHSHLTMHQRGHSDDRQFQCNLCAKAFKYQSRLAQHQRSH